jgi:predicted DNA-binding protein
MANIRHDSQLYTFSLKKSLLERLKTAKWTAKKSVSELIREGIELVLAEIETTK